MYKFIPDDDIKKVKKSMIYFLTGSMTLIIALSWNSAFANFIEKFFPNKPTNIAGHFIYAIILTLIFTVLTIYFIDSEYIPAVIKK
jgi:uncharacterized membrane protein (DUF106 family)